MSAAAIRELDLRLEQRSTPQVGARRQLLRRHERGAVEGLADRSRRGVDIALGQSHQRETGLWVPPSLMRCHEGLFRAVDVASAQSDPAELGQRPSQLASQIGPQLVAGQQGLHLCVVALPSHPEDLRPVNPAPSVQAPDGVRPRPSLHRLGPFLGQVVERESLECAHQLAVDDAGREGVEVSRGRSHSCLVEQCETARDIAIEDDDASLGDPSDGGGRRVTPRTDLARLTGTCERALPVADQHALVATDHRKPGVGRRLVALVEQLLRREQAIRGPVP